MLGPGEKLKTRALVKPPLLYGTDFDHWSILNQGWDILCISQLKMQEKFDKKQELNKSSDCKEKNLDNRAEWSIIVQVSSESP